MVMYAGRLVEEASAHELFRDPHHPYTRGLLRAMPRGTPQGPDRRLPTLPGTVPDAAAPPPGCRFHPRCAERLLWCCEPGPQKRIERSATPQLPVIVNGVMFTLG